jgi:hypothetical protein
MKLQKDSDMMVLKHLKHSRGSASVNTHTTAVAIQEMADDLDLSIAKCLELL